MTEKRALGDQNVGKSQGSAGAEQKQLLANNPYQSAENMQIVRSQEQNSCKPGTVHDVHFEDTKDKPALTQVKDRLQSLLPVDGKYHVVFSNTKEGTSFSVTGPSTEANRKLAESIGKITSNDFWASAAELVKSGQGELSLTKQAAVSQGKVADSFKPVKDSQSQFPEVIKERTPAQPSSYDRAQESPSTKDSLLKDLQTAIPPGVDVSFSLQRDPTHRHADQVRYQPSKNLTPDQWKDLGEAVNNALQNPELAQYLSHGAHLASSNRALVAETPVIAKSETSRQTTDSNSNADTAGYNKQDKRFELGASEAYLKEHPELAARIQQEQVPDYPEPKMVADPRLVAKVSDSNQKYLHCDEMVAFGNGYSARITLTAENRIPVDAKEPFAIAAHLKHGSGAVTHVEGTLHEENGLKYFRIKNATINNIAVTYGQNGKYPDVLLDDR